MSDQANPASAPQAPGNTPGNNAAANIPNPFATAAPQVPAQPAAPAQPAVATPVAPQAPAQPAAPTPPAQAEADKETLVLDIKGQKKTEEDSGPTISIFKQIDDYLVNAGSIGLDEKLLFFQLLASMIGAGLPIIDALNLLGNQTKTKNFKT